MEQYKQCTGGGKPSIRVETSPVENDFSKIDEINRLIEKKLNFILEHSWSSYKGNGKQCGEYMGIRKGTMHLKMQI